MPIGSYLTRDAFLYICITYIALMFVKYNAVKYTNILAFLLYLKNYNYCYFSMENALHLNFFFFFSTLPMAPAGLMEAADGQPPPVRSAG